MGGKPIIWAEDTAFVGAIVAPAGAVDVGPEVVVEVPGL
jgi:hypothetical protein